MLSSRILQIVGSLALAYFVGLIHADPWVEPEYGAVSTDFRSEQGQNTNYAASQSANSGTGSHYGDDYLTIAESSQRPRRGGRRPPPPRRRRGPPGKGHGPPHKEEHHHHHGSASNNHGWGGGGGGWDGKTEKIVIHHYHAAKPQKKRRKNFIPRLKFIPFGG